jgi:8-oxo-dGTP diphosphatase
MSTSDRWRRVDLRGRYLLLTPLLWALLACESPPPCSYTGEATTAISAGCIVVHEGKLLLSQGWSTDFGPPGGSVDDSESAQCAAERETWEETGVAVRVVSLERTFPNGFKLYWCEPVNAEPVPYRQRVLEIKSAGFFSPDEFMEFAWRFPEQAEWLREIMATRASTAQKEF